MTSLPTLTAKDFKSDLKPIWCPGCGDFGVLNAVYNSLRAKGYAAEDVVLVSGIGCSSRLPFFSSTYGFHTVHGRTMPIATGIKVANPALKVLALGEIEVLQNAEVEILKARAFQNVAAGAAIVEAHGLDERRPGCSTAANRRTTCTRSAARARDRSRSLTCAAPTRRQ